MHFWIDKRSQTCGFGRARVAASLSGSTGVGLGFGHPPRRMVGKSLVTPSIHRMQAASSDCNRPHVQNNNSNNNHNNSNNNGSINNTTTHNNNSNNNNVNRTHRNRSNNNNGGNGGGGGVVGVGGILNNAAQIHHENNGNHYHHLSTSNNGTGFISRHHQQNSVVENVHNQNLQRSPLASVNNQDYSIPVSLPHIYGGPSHTQELEQGSLGLGPITARPNLSAGTIGGTVSANVAMVDTSDSQLLPSHLKCGMWASLVLASVFVAGAKFYFDHQGTGLEVLIFCAFSATFFLAACTVSLCRLPRDLATSPSPSVDGHNRALDGHHIITSHNNYTHHQSNQQQHHQLYATNSGEILEVPITHHQQYNNSMATSHITTTTTSAPPPPYHIAILLPENSKDLQLDETPPPSYDKIII